MINYCLGNVLIPEGFRFKDYVAVDMDFPRSLNWVPSHFSFVNKAEYACNMYVYIHTCFLVL